MLCSYKTRVSYWRGYVAVLGSYFGQTGLAFESVCRALSDVHGLIPDQYLSLTWLGRSLTESQGLKD